jgi:hypothetical protein
MTWSNQTATEGPLEEEHEEEHEDKRSISPIWD